MFRKLSLLASVTFAVLVQTLPGAAQAPRPTRDFPAFTGNGWFVGFTTPSPGDVQCRAIAMGETSVSFIIRPGSRTPTIFLTNPRWRVDNAAEGSVTFQGFGTTMTLRMEWYIDMDPRWTGPNALGARLTEAEARQYVPFLVEVLYGIDRSAPVQVTLPDGSRFSFNSAFGPPADAVGRCNDYMSGR